MERWTHISRLSEDTTVFPWENRTPWSGLRAIVALAIALIAGQWSGHESAGAIAAGAAFTIGFAVYHEALASALLSMSVITLGIASATLLGSLGAQWTPVVLLLAIVAGINYGLLSMLGPTSGWIGQQCGVFAIISSFFPRGLHYAAGRASMGIGGGLLQRAVFTGARLWTDRKFLRLPEPKQMAQRGRELWAGLRAQARLHRNNETLPYIIRLCIVLVLSTALYRREHLGNGYWAPMTALLVLKPQWAHTLSRGIARLSGTLVGAGIALFVSWLNPESQLLFFVLVLGSAWACYTLQAVNYALFSCAITLYVVFLFRFGGFAQPHAAHLRLITTALGGGIALAVDAVWQMLAPKLGRESVHEEALS